VNKSCCGSFWAVGLIVLLLWVINTGVIAREEHYLEREFGDAYRAQRRLGRVQRLVC
jgi:protein-S-isoprenylcysteine O-methyltransferase Ste14